MSETNKNFKLSKASTSLTRGTESALGLEFTDVAAVTAQTPNAAPTPAPTPGGDVLQRDVFIGRATISSSDSPGDKVISDMDPIRMWLENPLVQARVRGYKWLHGEFVLTAITTAPGGCYGAYNVQAVCEGGLTGTKATRVVDGTSCDSFATSLQDVYGVINCSSMNAVQLHLPLFSLTDSISIVPGDTPPSWRIVMWPLAPIQSTAAPTATGSVSIYVRMLPGFILEGRTMQGDPEGNVDLNPSTGPSLAESIRSLLPPGGPERPPVRPPPPNRKLGESAANILAATASSFVAGLKSIASHVFLDPVPKVGATFSDGEFGSLFSRWTIARRVTVSSTTPLGQVCAIPVSPFLPYTENGVDFHSPGGYTGLPFTYWRGSIEFMIYIPSHESIHGGLQIFWDPDIASEYSEDPTNWLEGTAATLSGTSAKKVRIGMSAQVPTRLCHVYRPGENPNSSGANGFLVLYLTSQMSCPRPGASLTILVLTRCGSDVRFSVPRHITRVGEGRVRPIGEAYRLQADPAVDISADPTVDSILQEPASGLSVLRATSDISSFLRAKSWGGQVKIARYPTEMGSNCFFIRSFPLPPSTSRHGHQSNHLPSMHPSPSPWTWGGYYGAMFVGIRGSTRVTLIARGGSLPRVAVSLCAGEECARFGVAEGFDVVNNFYGFVSSPGMYGGIPITLPENEPVVVTLPDDDPRPFRHSRVSHAHPTAFPRGDESTTYTSPYLRVLVGVSPVCESLPVWIDYYIEGGTDLEGVRFRRVPGVVVEDVVREEA